MSTDVERLVVDVLRRIDQRNRQERQAVGQQLSPDLVTVEDRVRRVGGTGRYAASTADDVAQQPPVSTVLGRRNDPQPSTERRVVSSGPEVPGDSLLRSEEREFVAVRVVRARLR